MPLKQMESSAQEHLEQQTVPRLNGGDEEKQKITVTKSTLQPQLAALRSVARLPFPAASDQNHNKKAVSQEK